MAVVFKTQIREHRGPPVESLRWGRGPKLNVHVVFTNLDGAKTAFRLAVKLARDLGARVTVLAAQWFLIRCLWKGLPLRLSSLSGRCCGW